MARVRLVVGDQSSVETDQLRRTVNALLLMLESAEASLTAGASAEDVLNAWADGVRTGLDNNSSSISNISPTNAEVVGLRVMNRHPSRPGMAVGRGLVTMELDDAQK